MKAILYNNIGVNFVMFWSDTLHADFVKNHQAAALMTL